VSASENERKILIPGRSICISFSQYQVVVGNRKSYDHLIKLKSEYGGSLSWVLPYPGD
jgi:hypothetical protein